MRKKSNDDGGQPPDTHPVVFSNVLLTVILRSGNFIFIQFGMEIVD